LEGSGAIGHSEEHYKGFKEAAISVEGCFPFISRLDAYIIEVPADIEFCEVFSSVELRDEFRDEGKRIFVLDGHGIVTPQANFLRKITFDMLYTNEFVIRVRSRALSIPSERNTI